MPVVGDREMRTDLRFTEAAAVPADRLSEEKEGRGGIKVNF